MKAVMFPWTSLQNQIDKRKRKEAPTFKSSFAVGRSATKEGGARKIFFQKRKEKQASKQANEKHYRTWLNREKQNLQTQD